MSAIRVLCLLGYISPTGMWCRVEPDMALWQAPPPSAPLPLLPLQAATHPMTPSHLISFKLRSHPSSFWWSFPSGLGVGPPIPALGVLELTSQEGKVLTTDLLFLLLLLLCSLSSSNAHVLCP